MKNRESELQIACVTWFRYRYPKLSKMLIAIPNGHYRSKLTGSILKCEGVTAGVSDLILLIKSGSFGCLCIEMKTEIGKQSDVQKEWQKHAEKAGNRYVVCRKVDDFITEIENYLVDAIIAKLTYHE